MVEVKFRTMNKDDLRELVGKVVVVQGERSLFYGELEEYENRFYVNRCGRGSRGRHMIQDGELLTYRNEEGINYFHMDEIVLG